MTFKTAEIGLSIILFVGSIIAWFSIRDIPADAQMFPNFILGGIAVCSIIMIIRSLTGASARALGKDIENWVFSDNVKRMFGALAIFVVYLLIVDHVGYFTSSALLILALARFAGFQNWLALVATAAGFCLFVYLIFVLLFARPLPQEFFISIFAAAS